MRAVLVMIFLSWAGTIALLIWAPLVLAGVLGFSLLLWVIVGALALLDKVRGAKHG